MKALISVIFRSTEQTGKQFPIVNKGKNKGICYRPNLVVTGGNGEPLGFQFNEAGIFQSGEKIVTEIESLFDDPDLILGGGMNYGEVIPNAKFLLLEGSRVIADGTVLAVSPIKK